ncbi:MAG: TolB domain-containing protein, partial [Paenisporosarcina sp.]
MAKLVYFLFILCLIFPSIVSAKVHDERVKVAFIKDDYLWVQINDKIEKLTDKKATYRYPPQWSFDGKMLLYQKETVE